MNNKKVYARVNEIPENFEEVNQRYKNGEINSSEAADLLGISRHTFKDWSELGLEVISKSEKIKNNFYYGADRKEDRLKLFNDHLYFIDFFIKKCVSVRDIPDKDDLKQELTIGLWEFTADYLKKYEGENFTAILRTRLKHILYHYRGKLYAEKRGYKKTESADTLLEGEDGENDLYDKYFRTDLNEVDEIVSKIFIEEWVDEAKLSNREKQAVYATIYGYTNREAAELFNCGKSTIQYAWSNAKEKLKITYLNWRH